MKSAGSAFLEIIRELSYDHAKADTNLCEFALMALFIVFSLLYFITKVLTICISYDFYLLNYPTFPLVVQKIAASQYVSHPLPVC